MIISPCQISTQSLCLGTWKYEKETLYSFSLQQDSDIHSLIQVDQKHFTETKIKAIFIVKQG